MDEATTALATLSSRQDRYRHYANYYDGDHRLAFATPKFESAFGRLFQAFADNLCPSVVDTLADRLSVGGFDEDGSGDTDTDAEAQTAAIWAANRMDRRSGEVHVEALKSGDAYLVVWPDADNQPVLHVNRGARMLVWYDEERPGRVEWAAKCWPQMDGKLRLTLYYPDRIEKYITRTKATSWPKTLQAFQPYETPAEAWPLRNDWGQVPVFHFANNAGVGEAGRSELRDVIPLQDALNKSIADMLVAMEHYALPRRWVTGLEFPIDPLTGQPTKPWDAAMDSIWSTPAKDAQFGQFPSAALGEFISTQESFRKEIASVSRTPLHYLMPPTGTFPSGESLKTAEAPLTSKVTDRTVAFGNVWEDVMRFALRVAGMKAPPVLSCVWNDTTPRNDKDRAETVGTLTGAGASLQGAAEVAGYSPEEARKLAEVDMAIVSPVVPNGVAAL